MDFPAQLGPYRIVRRLGRGGMAEVFLAVAHGASGFEKHVALKTLLPELQGDGRYERILIEEARLAAGLSHPNLVGVHDLATAHGTYYVRMDWVDGADVGALLASGGPRPGVPVALRVASKVALALAYLHAARDGTGQALGLVHRDVSPGNVLVSRTGEVKLTDLGIAKATTRTDVTQGGVRKGKYAYMSPEQARGLRLGSASDQFALGVTLCELLVGRRPFDADSVLETLDRVREARMHDPTLLDPLDADLRAVVMRLLHLEPSARYTDMTAVYEALTDARRVRVHAGPAAVAQWVTQGMHAAGLTNRGE